MEGFRYVHRQVVVLRDLDGFGHVNNAVYLTYLENARVAYLKEVVGYETLEEIGNIMASVTLNFREALGFEDALEIGVRTTRIGSKSFGLAHEIRTADGRLAAEATTVQVTFDVLGRASIPVPDRWRSLLSEYDGLDAGPA
jgi:acyl-CoA thioester hydrolase